MNRIYQSFLKRVFDFILSLLALLVLSPLFLLLMVLGAIIMKGNPFFTQLRPGKDEKIFRLIKFRSMTCETDADGKPLPDEQRLVPYGKFLRSTSLDELPELINILLGQMSLVGPRPQLVRDMVFMTPAQRRRHSVRQGLTGLAQINGRNALTWENKLEYDLRYIEDISFSGDMAIIFKTIFKTLRRDGINEEGQATALDFGDYLLGKGCVSREAYEQKQEEARRLLAEATAP